MKFSTYLEEGPSMACLNEMGQVARSCPWQSHCRRQRFSNHFDREAYSETLYRRSATNMVFPIKPVLATALPGGALRTGI